ncbi:MAG: helix-turn-helix domain-containing protein [Bacteroidota bacterium]
MNLGYLFGLLSIGQGVFLVFYLLTTRTTERHVKAMLSLILTIEVLILYDEVFLSYESLLPWQLFYYGTAGAFLLGPSSYFLARKLKDSHFRLKTVHILHCLLFLLSLFLILREYHLLPIANKIAYIEFFRHPNSVNRDMSVAELLLNNVLRLHLLIYSLLAYLVVNSKKQITNESKLVTTKFAKFLFLGLCVLGFFTIGNAALNQLNLGDVNLKTEAFIVCFSSHIFGLSFIYFKRNYNQYREIRKYGKSGLSDQDETLIFNNLLALMRQDQLYTDALLTLPKLAKRLGTNTHYLSQVINVKTNQSYHTFINDYRCESAKHELINPRNSKKSVEEIGSMCGFGSASSFYRSFRRKYETTPMKYRQRHDSILG